MFAATRDGGWVEIDHQHALEIGGPLAVPVPTLPWLTVPAIGAAGALALPRRRREGMDSGTAESGQDDGIVGMLVSWDWMRQRKGVRIISRKLE